MAIIVRNVLTNENCILLGTGFGMFAGKISRDHIEAFSNQQMSGQKHVVTVCNLKGEIASWDYKDVQVISVDGQNPSKVLDEFLAPSP